MQLLSPDAKVISQYHTLIGSLIEFLGCCKELMLMFVLWKVRDYRALLTGNRALGEFIPHCSLKLFFNLCQLKLEDFSFLNFPSVCSWERNNFRLSVRLSLIKNISFVGCSCVSLACKPNAACVFNIMVNHYPRSLQIRKARNVAKMGKSGVNDFSRFFLYFSLWSDP